MRRTRCCAAAVLKMWMAQGKCVPISEHNLAPAEIAQPLKPSWFVFLVALALAMLVADQYSKWLAIQHLSYGVPVPVLVPWLNWTLVHNFGAAFSFLSQSGGMQHWFFVGIGNQDHPAG